MKVSLFAAIFVIVGIFIDISLGKEVDCSKRPNVMEVKSCCKIPDPIMISDIESACSQHKPLIPGTINPCLIECAFNVTGSLNTNNNQLNMANVKAMLRKSYQNDPEFMSTFSKGFAACASSVAARAEKRRNDRKMGLKLAEMQCPMLASPYVICAFHYVFANCPAASWTSTLPCEDAKAYANACDPLKGKHGGDKRLTDSKTQTKQRNGARPQSGNGAKSGQSNTGSYSNNNNDNGSGKRDIMAQITEALQSVILENLWEF